MFPTIQLSFKLLHLPTVNSNLIPVFTCLEEDEVMRLYAEAAARMTLLLKAARSLLNGMGSSDFAK